MFWSCAEREAQREREKERERERERERKREKGRERVLTIFVEIKSCVNSLAGEASLGKVKLFQF